MIYVLGDSFSFGYNFWQEQKLNRKELIYSHFLSQKINSPVKNLSVPGGSNWRIARILNNLELTENDYVIIGWSNNNRSEVGFNKSSLYPKDNIHTPDDLETTQLGTEDNISKIVYGFEKDNDIITAKLFPALYHGHGHIDVITNNPMKQFVKLTYEHFYNPEYLENMFLVFFNSAVYKCLRSKCKFVMFNVYWNAKSTQCDLLNIPEYFLGYDNNMTSFLRPNVKRKTGKWGLEYWTEEEQVKVADLIYNHLKELYDI